MDIPEMSVLSLRLPGLPDLKFHNNYLNPHLHYHPPRFDVHYQAAGPIASDEVSR